MAKGNKFQIDRSIFEWEWWDDHTVVIVWIYLIGQANWKPNKWHGYEIPRGSLVTSLRSIAKNCNLTVRQVRTAIEKLEATHNLTRKTTHRFTLITVENYDTYQLSPRWSDTVNDTLSDKLTTTLEYQRINNNKEREASGPPSPSLSSEIISYLNDKTGNTFKPDGAENIRLVSGLISAGYSTDDIKKVIDRKVDEWGEVDHMRYALRPRTLFKRSNFEEYLNAPETSKEYEDRTKAEKKEQAASDLVRFRKDAERLRKELVLEKDIRKRRDLQTKLDWTEERIDVIERRLNQ